MSFTERPTVSIRRHRLEQTFLARVPPAAQTRSVRGRAGGSGPAATLLQLGTVDEQLAAFLEAAVRARANIMIAGATDAGKTTLLRALIHCIPAHERLVTVEKALELGLRRHRYLHPDTVEMEVVLPGPDGSGGVDIGELVRRSLRMNPSRVIVGEVLGPEVVDMLYAMTQGNDGSLSTIHSRTAEDVFFRLGTLAGDYGNKAFPIAQAMISRAIDFVVFVRKNSRQDGRRVVSEVLEVSGSPDGRVASARIFAEDAYGRAQRVLDVPIMRAQQLAEHGYHETGFDPFWSMDDPRPTGDPGIPAYRDELSAQPWSSTLRPWER